MTDDPTTPGSRVQAGAALYDRLHGQATPEPVTAERNPGALLWDSLHSRDPQTRADARQALAERAASQQPAPREQGPSWLTHPEPTPTDV